MTRETFRESAAILADLLGCIRFYDVNMCEVEHSDYLAQLAAHDAVLSAKLNAWLDAGRDFSEYVKGRMG